MYESRRPETGGCRETLLLTKIAFAVLLPALGAIIGVIVLIIIFFFLFARHPALGLIPVALVAALLGWFAIRERRKADRDLEDLGPH